MVRLGGWLLPVPVRHELFVIFSKKFTWDLQPFPRSCELSSRLHLFFGTCRCSWHNVWLRKWSCPSWKWWRTVLEWENSCSQWEGLQPQSVLIFFSFKFWGGWLGKRERGGREDLFDSSFVPNMFPMVPIGSQYVPYVPNMWAKYGGTPSFHRIFYFVELP